MKTKKIFCYTGCLLLLASLNACNLGASPNNTPSAVSTPSNSGGQSSDGLGLRNVLNKKQQYLIQKDKLTDSLHFRLINPTNNEVALRFSLDEKDIQKGYYSAGYSGVGGNLYLFSSEEEAIIHYKTCKIGNGSLVSCSQSLPLSVDLGYVKDEGLKIQFSPNGKFAYLSSSWYNKIYKCAVASGNGGLSSCSVIVTANPANSKIMDTAMASFDGEAKLFYSISAQGVEQFGSCDLDEDTGASVMCRLSQAPSYVSAYRIAIDAKKRLLYTNDDQQNLVELEIEPDNHISFQAKKYLSGPIKGKLSALVISEDKMMYAIWDDPASSNRATKVSECVVGSIATSTLCSTPSDFNTYIGEWGAVIGYGP